MSDPAVIVAPGFEGLHEMLADLILGNLARDPGRAKLLAGNPATVNLHVTDAEVDVGLRFTGERLEIGEQHIEPDMTLTCDADTLMGMTNVPLRFGMPDQLTTAGRAIAAKMLNGELKVKGLPKQLPLMIRLQRLFTVA